MFQNETRIFFGIRNMKQNLRRLKTLLSWLLITMFTVVACTTDNGTHYLEAKVIAVHDGDTIRVTNQYGEKLKIRLAYIDAPELNQAGGLESKNILSGEILNRKVQLEILNTDQYGRKVAKVILNGEDINLKQIEQGQAWHYQSIAKRQQRKDEYQKYKQAETKAKSEKLGLWKNKKEVVAPWAFRKQDKLK